MKLAARSLAFFAMDRLMPGNPAKIINNIMLGKSATAV
jgi:hypothetical protein